MTVASCVRGDHDVPMLMNLPFDVAEDRRTVDRRISLEAYEMLHIAVRRLVRAEQAVPR